MKKIYLTFLIIYFVSFSLKSDEIKILEDTPGYGIEIKNHYKIKVNYRGKLENGIEFDSSFKRNKYFEFQIGLRQVILGWDQGLLGMKVGGKRTISIPPSLAYGSTGAGDLIAPNSTLIFDIEIIEATPPGYKNIFSRELKQKIKDGLILIDIRTAKEIEITGKIEEAIHITAFDIKGNFNPKFLEIYESVVSQNDHVVFVSDDGDVSAILANGFVEKLGLKNISTLVGGMQNWIGEERKVVK